MIVVHSVGDGDKSDIVLTEHHFRIKSCFKIVAPDSAHILRQNHANLSGFHVGNQTFPAGTVEIAAAPSVVRIVFAVGESMLIGVILQIELLVHDGVTFPVEVIVAGQALVQRRNQIFLQ